MDIKTMSIKELIREVKRLDKELPMEVWEKAFEEDDEYIISDLNDAIRAWSESQREFDPYNSMDWADTLHEATEIEDYPIYYGEPVERVREFFEIVLDMLSKVMEED